MGFRAATLDLGAMRHRVHVEMPVETLGNYGDVEQTWEVDRACWASIEPLRGREFLEAAQVKADVTHRIRMRWYDGLTPNHRIRFGQRIFNIESVVDVLSGRQMLEVMATEVKP
jgi:SPP1 family predicted phage head-tail adaptor